MPDISIVIPTYNRLSLLPAAIDSCFAEQASTVSIEVIVVNDASTDATEAMLQQYGNRIIAVHLRANAGQSSARNEGLQIASGQYIKFLDSDDVLARGALCQEMTLARTKGADIVVTGYGGVRIDIDGRESEVSRVTYPPPDPSPLPDSVLAGRGVPTSAALYRMSYIEGLKWDPLIVKLEEWDFYCQAALRGGVVVPLDIVSYWMRSHGGVRITTSSSMLTNAISHHAVLRKMEGSLRRSGQLTTARKSRLAQYYYKELRVLCLERNPLFEEGVIHIAELDPRFTPRDEERDWYMRVAGRILGCRTALLLHSGIKRLAKRRSGVSP